jgi:hypothetical protein
MKHYIQLIGFDGNSYWKLFYIEVQDNKDIYYGIIRKKGVLSFSRHGSGIMHLKTRDIKVNMKKIMPELKATPITKITSRESLGTFCPINSRKKISEKEYKKYFSKNCKGVFLIDLRNFNGTMNIQPYLINPQSKESLINHNFNHNCQLYVYTASNPWVAFYILDVLPKEHMVFPEST